MLTIDASMGEGGGQILRSSLALSAICQQPINLQNIRAKRSTPGLQAQHLCAVRAAARVCNAQLEGGELRSMEITCYPQEIQGGYYEFDIGTAGSCSLVLQTILPMFLHARCQAELRIFGGTHNPWSPSMDFMQHAFLPLLARMGARVDVEIDRYGFYPRGGGVLHVQIDASGFGGNLELMDRGRRVGMQSVVTTVNLPSNIGEREENRLRTKLGLKKKQQHYREITDAHCEGNFVSVVVESEHVTECFGEPARRGVQAERIADKVAKQVKKYLKGTAPVGEYLADQLMLPVMLADGGKYLATCASLHSTTNADVISLFCGDQVAITEQADASRFDIQPIRSGS